MNRFQEFLVGDSDADSEEEMPRVTHIVPTSEPVPTTVESRSAGPSSFSAAAEEPGRHPSPERKTGKEQPSTPTASAPTLTPMPAARGTEAGPGRSISLSTGFALPVLTSTSPPDSEEGRKRTDVVAAPRGVSFAPPSQKDEPENRSEESQRRTTAVVPAPSSKTVAPSPTETAGAQSVPAADSDPGTGLQQRSAAPPQRKKSFCLCFGGDSDSDAEERLVAPAVQPVSGTSPAPPPIEAAPQTDAGPFFSASAEPEAETAEPMEREEGNNTLGADTAPREPHSALSSPDSPTARRVAATSPKVSKDRISKSATVSTPLRRSTPVRRESPKDWEVDESLSPADELTPTPYSRSELPKGSGCKAGHHERRGAQPSHPHQLVGGQEGRSEEDSAGPTPCSSHGTGRSPALESGRQATRPRREPTSPSAAPESSTSSAKRKSYDSLLHLPHYQRRILLDQRAREREEENAVLRDVEWRDMTFRPRIYHPEQRRRFDAEEEPYLSDEENSCRSEEERAGRRRRNLVIDDATVDSIFQRLYQHRTRHVANTTYAPETYSFTPTITSLAQRYGRAAAGKDVVERLYRPRASERVPTAGGSPRGSERAATWHAMDGQMPTARSSSAATTHTSSAASYSTPKRMGVRASSDILTPVSAVQRRSRRAPYSNFSDLDRPLNRCSKYLAASRVPFFTEKDSHQPCHRTPFATVVREPQVNVSRRSGSTPYGVDNDS